MSSLMTPRRGPAMFIYMTDMPRPTASLSSESLWWATSGSVEGDFLWGLFGEQRPFPHSSPKSTTFCCWVGQTTTFCSFIREEALSFIYINDSETQPHTHPHTLYFGIWSFLSLHVWAISPLSTRSDCLCLIVVIALSFIKMLNFNLFWKLDED